MAESDLSTQEWSAADDELVRSALDSLRLDVELLPLNTPAPPHTVALRRGHPCRDGCGRDGCVLIWCPGVRTGHHQPGNRVEHGARNHKPHRDSHLE